MEKPFVSFKMNPTLNVDSPPTLIFGADLTTTLLDSVLLASQVETVLLATVWVSREIETGSETKFVLCSRITILPFERVDLLINTTLTLEPGDLLYASSDYSDNLFNAFVSYRSLNELGVS